MAKYTIKHSAELMQNYMQTSIMAPEKAFQAVQKKDGGALLFSIGTDGDFNLTAESWGERNGWNTVNLSGQGAPCQLFGVAERPDGSVQLAIARRATQDGKPHDGFYLANLTAAQAASGAVPTWAAVPYDAAGPVRSRIEIANIFVSNASDGEFIVVDLVRDPDSANKVITRYYIDRAGAGPRWKLHDVPVDIGSEHYTSVLGRKDGSDVDGVYVSGQIDGHPQILYTPLYPDSPGGHVFSSSLKLTANGVIADAVAACRKADNSSDLYAAAQGKLYRFDSTNQKNLSVATVVLENPLFAHVQQLYAFCDVDKVMVWGRNNENTIFYTACALSKLNDAQSGWSLPLPLAFGVEHVSAYVNRGNSANTIFVHASDSGLRVGTKSPGTGTWAWRRVTLTPRDAKQAATTFNSFTTRIQIRDSDCKPANGVTVAISASAVTGVYINHLYYAVGPVPIHVKADQAGSVTIIEVVPHLTGTRFDVSVVDDASQPISVNPMDKAFTKATSLQSRERLRTAKIRRYVKGADGILRVETRDLIKPGIDDAVLDRVASLNKQLATAYANPDKAPATAVLLYSSDQGFVVPPDAPRVDAGDLFQFLEARSDHLRLQARAHPDSLAAAESFWEMLVRWFEGAWEFVVKIGEVIYRCVLKVVEVIVSAVRWVFENIVNAIEDLVEFLQYLFEWDDIKRTKDVIHNVSRLFMSHQVDQIPVLRNGFDEAIESTIKSIDQWAGIKDFPGLGTDGSGRISSKATEDGPDAPGSLLMHHYQGNIHAASQSDAAGGLDLSQALLDALEAAMKGEKRTLDKAFGQLRDLMREAPGMSVVAILQRLTGILADAVLRSAKVVIDALFDIFSAIAKKALALLDSPMHIPVISDILNAIGVPDFSALDVVCWIAAVPATIGYKVAAALAGKERRAPFPDNAETRLLIQANDFLVLAAAFKGATPSLRTTPLATMTASDNSVEMSEQTAEAVAISLHAVSGVCGIVSAFIDADESLLPETAVPKPLSYGCVASAIIGGGSRAAANFFVPRYPLEGFLDRYYSVVTTGYFLLNKLIWGIVGAAGYPRARFNGAVVDAVLVIPSLVITCIHFSQLGQKPAGKERSIAIIDETSFMSTYASRVLYTLVVTGVFDGDEEVKIGVAATMGVFQVVHGSLQFAESAVEWLA